MIEDQYFHKEIKILYQERKCSRQSTNIITICYRNEKGIVADDQKKELDI